MGSPHPRVELGTGKECPAPALGCSRVRDPRPTLPGILSVLWGGGREGLIVPVGTRGPGQLTQGLLGGEAEGCPQAEGAGSSSQLR